jgi:transposase
MLVQGLYKVFDRRQPAQGKINPPIIMTTTTAKPAAFIGLDWADKKHDLCLRPGLDAPAEFSILEHSPQALADWVARLRARFAGAPVLVCTEQARGPLVNFLLQHDFIQLSLPNPKSVASFRQTLRPSGAKDDLHDSQILCDLGRLHAQDFPRWVPHRPETRLLQALTELRRKVVDDRTRLVLELQAALKLAYPLVLELFDDLTLPMAWAFLAQWPAFAALKKARSQAIREFFYAHNSRSEEKIQERLAAIAQAQPLTEDLAAVQSVRLAVIDLTRRLDSAQESIDEYDGEIARVFAAHPDAAIFKSLPGAGKVMAPRLLAAFGDDRSRFASAADPQQYFGIAPITIQSGRSRAVHYRRGCPIFLRQSIHEFAGLSLRYCSWAHSYVEALKARGKTHCQAVRSLAFKWLRIIFRMWKDRVPYDEPRYLEALRRRGSPHALAQASASTDQNPPAPIENR